MSLTDRPRVKSLASATAFGERILAGGFSGRLVVELRSEVFDPITRLDDGGSGHKSLLRNETGHVAMAAPEKQKLGSSLYHSLNGISGPHRREIDRSTTIAAWRSGYMGGEPMGTQSHPVPQSNGGR
ncbi:hypothetical protein AYL99_08710 [Fonsecaea erecta]|uniref:Uncharacterized protein n=1 Tax=Fonsecaea erecta TaxID=1367422 RepID=A0A178Z9Y2_9EURO|nr:hypothetical protein AYL99_08710 [Fonsecaea erecta]OAP56598.1 hypothetical protein AYL99_08710 [Fonsecaea erecta]